MRKIKLFLPLLFSLLVITLGGCIKDQCEKTYRYTYYQPIYKSAAEVRENIRSNKPREIENPGKLFVLGRYIFLNEVDKGVHIIDNSNPAAPDNVAFIDIPGNLDLAVKGNFLFADLYTDLVSIDISTPLNVKVVSYNEGVFPHRAYGHGFGLDSANIITEWVKKDTLVSQSCNWSPVWYDYYMNAAYSSSNATVSSSPVGKGGSMARFTLINNYLYTVSYSSLNIFNISRPEKPAFVSEVMVDGLQLVETIFPLDDQLFIGAQNGMNIYTVSNPSSPVLLGKFAHVRSCDPVISDGKYAYVTLRSGSACAGFTNQLEVLSLNVISNPKLLKTYEMINPHGLSKDGDLLFICDGDSGLKMYDAADVMNLKLLQTASGIHTYDVIAGGGLALVVAKDGLYQYKYGEGKLDFVSRLGIKTE